MATLNKPMLFRGSRCLDMLNKFWEFIALWVVIFIALSVGSLLLLPLLSMLNIPSFQLSIGSWILLSREQAETGFSIEFSQWTLSAIALMATLFSVVIRRLFRRAQRRSIQRDMCR